MDGRRLGVEPICEVLQVASSSYYAARERPLSPRAQRDATLIPKLVEIWKDNYRSTVPGSCGRPRGGRGSMSAGTRPCG